MQVGEVDALLRKYLGVGLGVALLVPSRCWQVPALQWGCSFPKFEATALLQFPEAQKSLERPGEPRCPSSGPGPEGQCHRAGGLQARCGLYDSARSWAPIWSCRAEQPSGSRALAQAGRGPGLLEQSGGAGASLQPARPEGVRRYQGRVGHDHARAGTHGRCAHRARCAGHGRHAGQLLHQCRRARADARVDSCRQGGRAVAGKGRSRGHPAGGTRYRTLRSARRGHEGDAGALSGCGTHGLPPGRQRESRPKAANDTCHRWRSWWAPRARFRSGAS